MKPTLFSFVIALFISALSSHAQTFAPAGSEWYHSMNYGAFHSYYDGDTIIAGQACRKVKNTALTADPHYSQGLRVQDHPAICVYDNADTVFIYNALFDKFTPLYVFNVSDDDTVTLPIIPLDFGVLQFVSTDSTFSFRVDSVRMKLYDTAWLKTVYTHELSNPAGNYVYRYATVPGDQGAYAQRIGGLYTGLLPRGEPAAFTLSDALQPLRDMRCYSDATMFIKMVSGICGIPPVSVDAVGNARAVSVYPNPANSRVTVSGLSAGSSVALTDVTGRVVAVYTAPAGTVVLSTDTLHPGVYVLTFTQADGSAMHRQIIVAR